mmetsp:Transcript_5904/g.9859  ORF Transcript_5904/g.9859 Transcript_5904/m.9859 type:complete len:291 (-) Transcript_5904:24-896(-)
MRLSAQIIQSAEQRTNPLGEREIILRSLAIPAIEHLAVSRDQFDTMDLSNNHLQRLDNFPKMERLATLYLGGNEISYVDARNLKKNVPNLNTVIMTGNGVKGWNVLSDLGEGCPKLEYLSLVGNPITRRQHYRLYTIHKIPTLKVLDFQKVKQSERERAQRLAASAAGAAMEADCRLEARAAASSAADDGAVTSKSYNGDNETNTFEPGEGKNAEESFATQFTLEEKAQIREMVANAASAEEIDRIENLVKKGIFPGKTDNSGSIPPPPPPPPSEDQDNEPSKRQKTDDD